MRHGPITTFVAIPIVGATVVSVAAGCGARRDAAGAEGAAPVEAKRRSLRELNQSEPAVVDVARGRIVASLSDADAEARLLAVSLVLNNSSRWQDADTVGSALRVLGEALNDPKPEVRRDASSRLYGVGDNVGQMSAFMPGLLRSIETEDDGEVWGMVEHLFDTMKEKAAPAAEGLTKLLESPRSRTRVRAARLLHYVQEPAKAAVPNLLRLLDGNDRETVVAAHIAIRYIDEGSVPEPSPVKKHLSWYARQLREGNMEQGFMALDTLGKIGPQAAETIPDILAFLERIKDSKQLEEGGLYVAGVMGMFGDEGVTEYLKVIRKGDDAVAATWAALFLGNGRSAYANAIPEMVKLVGQTRGTVKAQLLEALGSVGREDPTIVPVLLEAAKDEDPEMRSGAFVGLSFQEAPTEQILAVFEKALADDPHPKIRESAKWWVQKTKTSLSLREQERRFQR